MFKVKKGLAPEIVQDLLVESDENHHNLNGWNQLGGQIVNLLLFATPPLSCAALVKKNKDPNSPIPHSPMVIKINFFKSLYIIYHLIQNLMLMKFYERTND